MYKLELPVGYGDIVYIYPYGIDFMTFKDGKEIRYVKRCRITKIGINRQGIHFKMYEETKEIIVGDVHDCDLEDFGVWVFTEEQKFDKLDKIRDLMHEAFDGLDMELAELKFQNEVASFGVDVYNEVIPKEAQTQIDGAWHIDERYNIELIDIIKIYNENGRLNRHSFDDFEFGYDVYKYIEEMDKNEKTK